MDPSTYNGNGTFAKELEAELMKFTKKDEDPKVEAHSVEQTGESERTSDVEINITECTKSVGNKLFGGVYQDTTESSSSFDGSDCGTENVDTFGDSEAQSDFCDDATLARDFNGFGERFRMRKRKLTTHWRSFIQPLMWRCKWVELQIKKLQSQAQQYDRELEAYNKQKQIQLENSTLENGVKSLPFSQVNARSDVLKRKKRRKSEATMDVKAYMSRHNLFSYYENKKCLSECAFVCNELKNPAAHKVNVDDEFVTKDDLLSIEPGDGDNSLEHLLGRIDYLQSQVGKLKSRVDRVMSENAAKFSCPDILNLPMPCSASTPDCGDNMVLGNYIASQLISEYRMGDVGVPESAVTRHGDVDPDANGSMAHVRFADAHENAEDEILIDNQRVKEEMNSFKEVKIPPVQRPLVLKDRLGDTSKDEVNNFVDVKIHPIRSPSALKDGLGSSTPSAPIEPDQPADDQPPPKIRSIAKITAPKIKRKRGRRKGAGRWSRRPKV